MGSISMVSLPSRMEEESNGPPSSDGSSTASFDGQTRKGFTCTWKHLLLLVFIAGCIGALIGIASTVNYYHTKDDGNQATQQQNAPPIYGKSMQTSSGQFQIDARSDTREKLVIGATAPCEQPFCERCRKDLAAESRALEEEHPCNWSNELAFSERITNTNVPEACFNCDSSRCLTYDNITAVLARDGQLHCDAGYSVTRMDKCCPLALVGNRANYCDGGGALKCESHGLWKPPRCACPHGKTGTRCQEDISTPFTCSCHKGVAGLCDDVPECDPRHMYNSSREGRDTCKIRITSADNTVYNCYCRETDSGTSSMQKCEDLQGMSGMTPENYITSESKQMQDTQHTNGAETAHGSHAITYIVLILCAWLFSMT